MDKYLKDKRLIVVSNRVPYIISKVRDEIVYKNCRRLSYCIRSIIKKIEGLWIGWDGTIGSSNKIKDRIKIGENNSSKGYELKLVKLNENEVKDYYGGFSNRTLWPLFHGFLFQSYFDYDYWKAYQRINKKFANEVISVSDKMI